MFHHKWCFRTRSKVHVLPKKTGDEPMFSVHDDWMFSEARNLKLHNKICKFEQARTWPCDRELLLFVFSVRV